MEAAGNIAENNTNVQQWDLNGGDSENTNTPDKWNTWRLFDAGEGYYYIVSQMADGATYALDVSGKKADNGTNICIYEFNGGDNQKFKFAKNSDGSYKILTKVSNDKSAVEIENGSAEYGANVQEWEINGAECQNWILESAPNFGTEMDTNLIYTFSNANSGLVMDIENGVMADGSNVRQWESNEFDCQKWKLVSGGKENCYFIKSCMNESYGLYIEDSGNLCINAIDSKDSKMLFKFAKNIDGTYSVMTVSSDCSKVLEVGGAATDIGGNIQQWDLNGHSCQKWNIITTEIPKVKGDVNADGILSIADAVLLQKWLAAVPETILEDKNAADMSEDGKINIYDLCIMKNELMKS